MCKIFHWVVIVPFDWATQVIENCYCLTVLNWFNVSVSVIPILGCRAFLCQEPRGKHTECVLRCFPHSVELLHVNFYHSYSCLGISVPVLGVESPEYMLNFLLFSFEASNVQTINRLYSYWNILCKLLMASVDRLPFIVF